MASTYSNLKIQLMATGENSGTWGNVTNVNLGTAIEEAITGSADVPFSSADVTLTLTDTNASQTARNLRLNLTGTTGGAKNLIVPAIEKMYLVNNGCADAVTVKNSTGTGIAVPAGKTMLVFNDGTNVVDGDTHLSSLILGSALPIASGGTWSTSTTYANLQSNVSGVLPVANGGTGSATAAFSGENITSLNASNISAGTLAVGRGGTGATTLNANAVIIGNATSAVTFVAPGTSGNVLTSDGTVWASQAISAGGDYIMQTYTSPATWSKPSNAKAFRVTVVGGGGGGGGGGNANQATAPGGGGGGGGAAVEYFDAPAVPGPISITVGSGGNAGGSVNTPGGTGGTSSFGNLCSATGGSGGTTTGPGGGRIFPAGNGGAGSGGSFNSTGGGGGIGFVFEANAEGFFVGGAGGPSILGGGGGSVGDPAPSSTAGKAGGAYGGGGGGATRSNTPSPLSGGAGAAGIVIVEEFY